MQQQNKNIFTTFSLVSLALMFCLPFMVSYHKWPESNYYNQALAFFLGSASLVVFLFRDSKSFSIPITVFVPIGLSLLIALQWFVGMGFYWQEAAMGVIYLLWAALLMLVVQQLKAKLGLEVIIRWLAYGLMIGGLFNVLVVLMQLIGADGYFWTFPRIRKSYTGNLAQVNLLTDYLSLSLVSMLYLFNTNRLKLKLVGVMVFLVLIALTLTGSRMSWLFIMLITITSFYFGKKGGSDCWRLSSKFILLLPVIYGVLQFAFPYLIGLFANTAVAIPPIPAERVVEFAGKESIRLDMLRQSWEIFTSYPLLGVGWGQYPWYDLLLADTYTGHEGYVMHSHNLFVQMLVECGIAAGLILLIGVIYWFVNILRHKLTPENWWVLLVASIVFMHSMLEYPLWYAHFLGVFLVVVSLGDKSIDVRTFKSSVVTAVTSIILLGAVSLIVMTTYQYKQIEYWVTQYSFLSKQQRFDMLNQMTAMHQKTLIAEPLHMVLTRAYSLLPREQAPLKSKIARYETMMHYVQAKEDLYRYVLLLAADGRLEDAKLFLKRAVVRQPAYAKHFEARLAKNVEKGSKVHTMLYEELIRLHANE